MKLVYRIVFHIFWALSLLLVGWAVLFYVTLIDEVDDTVDHILENLSEQLIRQTLAGGENAESLLKGSDCYLQEVTSNYAATHPTTIFSNEKIYIPSKQWSEQARVLRTIFMDKHGRYFELTVMAPSVERDDLQEAILNGVVLLYVLLLLTILAINIAVLYRTLRPLYALLRWLDANTVGGGNIPLANETGITEFRRLNEAVSSYARRSELLFDRQKQFIGNASHEMQTPLAVCCNRLEMLMGDDSTLTEEQFGEILKVRRSLEHLVRLNKSLLLLTKIDNGQFPETEPIDFNALIERTLADMSEIYGIRGIRTALRDEGLLEFHMNPSLALCMVSNLLKNAFVHNREGGEITVRVDSEVFSVCNTGMNRPLDEEHLFERFYQRHKKEGSTGLGLSIVDAVCRMYGLRISYVYSDSRHCFSVFFAQQALKKTKNRI